jgi:hypothetical protein
MKKNKTLFVLCNQGECREVAVHCFITLNNYEESNCFYHQPFCTRIQIKDTPIFRSLIDGDQGAWGVICSSGITQKMLDTLKKHKRKKLNFDFETSENKE